MVRATVVALPICLSGLSVCPAGRGTQLTRGAGGTGQRLPSAGGPPLRYRSEAEAQIAAAVLPEEVRLFKRYFKM
jgi:hypothetical protein